MQDCNHRYEKDKQKDTKGTIHEAYQSNDELSVGLDDEINRAIDMGTNQLNPLIVTVHTPSW